MICSTFRHPFFPYCGADSGNDHIINVPRRVLQVKYLRPAVMIGRPHLDVLPQLLLISAGFDAHREERP